MDIEHLKEKILQADHDYYELGQSSISDAEYDQLKRQLAQLEGDSGLSARVSGKAGFAKVKHQTRMLSLDNSFSGAEVAKFFHGVQSDLVVEFKIDGLSLAHRYQDGMLVQSVTRGNGELGDDVTANVRANKMVPEQLEHFTGEIRGEAYMPRSTFAQLNRQLEQAGEPLMANARNAAAGSMKLKDAAKSGMRGIKFMAYRVIPSQFQTQLNCLSWLDSQGFEVPPHAGISASEIDHLIASMSALRHDLDFDVDGLVFKVNELKLQEELGEGTKSPKWATAYKFPTEKVQTHLLDIVLTVGRTGQITPNAVLKPVVLGGSVVKAASLCNQEEIDRLGIEIGDDVWVEKAAEIIPRVVGKVIH